MTEPLDLSPVVEIVMDHMNQWFDLLDQEDLEDGAGHAADEIHDWYKTNLDGTDLKEEPSGSRGPVYLSDSDFAFIYDAFLVLMSPWSTNEELIEIIKAEDAIWLMLQRVAAQRRGHI